VYIRYITTIKSNPYGRTSVLSYGHTLLTLRKPNTEYLLNKGCDIFPKRKYREEVRNGYQNNKGL
jgi:hypothetical protein